MSNLLIFLFVFLLLYMELAFLNTNEFSLFDLPVILMDAFGCKKQNLIQSDLDKERKVLSLAIKF